MASSRYVPEAVAARREVIAELVGKDVDRELVALATASSPYTGRLASAGRLSGRLVAPVQRILVADILLDLDRTSRRTILHFGPFSADPCLTPCRRTFVSIRVVLCRCVSSGAAGARSDAAFVSSCVVS